jgi:predicted amidophosphoribosyltransferase
MKKDNKTICSYCGKRFNFDTMKYGLCSDCYEMIIRLGYENRIDYKKELINDFYNYLNNLFLKN